jgi:outer membrane protein assembly factor BamB
VFVGDVGGNFYALDALSGEKLWSRKIGGAIGGGRHRLGAADLRPAQSSRRRCRSVICVTSSYGELWLNA